MLSRLNLVKIGLEHMLKVVANKRGHLPAQATTTLAGCERPGFASIRLRPIAEHVMLTEGRP